MFRNLMDKSPLLFFATAMTVIVAASNYAVQFPINDFLTWGAFTYPVSFLITEIANRFFGPKIARRAVYVGFFTAVVISLWLASPQIALASGAAFLCAQLMDITIFNSLRRYSWWRAPLVAGSVASAADTLVFFAIAFAGTGSLWMTLALGDFAFKLTMAVFMLVPFRLVLWRVVGTGVAACPPQS